MTQAIPTRKYNRSVPTMHEFIVLCAIRKAGGEFVDVPTLMTALRQRAQVEFPHTATYTILRRLEKDGLVFMTDQPHANRGESRHFYSLTDEGFAFLTEWFGKITAML